MKKIINLEINEISPNLLRNYIDTHKDSNLAKLEASKLLYIFKTKALDVPKNKLYPSQTWASINTGLAYDQHKCYWYSDFIECKNLIWNKLVRNNKTVGILGSIHSSKYPNDLFKNTNYKFYLPDCFSNKAITKPNSYQFFQDFNNELVSNSGRVTGLRNLFLKFLAYFKKVFLFPKHFGVSFLSLKMIFLIFFVSLKYKNREFLRMAQFPLIGSIFLDLLKQHKPEYSTLFSNHIAGNMHRYWYAHEISSFKNKNKYPKKWIKRNKEAINIGIGLLDKYLGNLIYDNEFKNYTLLITSSMGQEPNPEFDQKPLSKYDGKIYNMDLFINELRRYQKVTQNIEIKYKYSRNMAPQYGFDFCDQKYLDLDMVKDSIAKFITFLGLKFKIDKEGFSLVLTIDPYTDLNLQKKFNMNEANYKYSSYGFNFFKIDDHHSGSHCPDGSLILINSNKKLLNCVRKFSDNDGNLNYLNFNNVILEYYLN